MAQWLAGAIVIVMILNWIDKAISSTIHITILESYMKRLIQALRHNKLTLAKTGSYYLIHITVAACVAYAVTGNLIASLTLSLLEPTVQAFAFFFHEKVWERRLKKQEQQHEQALAA